MGSKVAILLFGLLAILILISSEVSARDLAETSSNSKETEVTKELGDAKYPGNGGGYPGGGYNGGGYPGRGGHGGGYPGHGGHGGGYPGHGGHGGGYPGGGGHGGGYPGRGGHGGGYCRFGCCRGAYRGGCSRCCSYAGEAITAQTEEKHT